MMSEDQNSSSLPTSDNLQFLSEAESLAAGSNTPSNISEPEITPSAAAGGSRMSLPVNLSLSSPMVR